VFDAIQPAIQQKDAGGTSVARARPAKSLGANSKDRDLPGKLETGSSMPGVVSVSLAVFTRVCMDQGLAAFSIAGIRLTESSLPPSLPPSLQIPSLPPSLPPLPPLLSPCCPALLPHAPVCNHTFSHSVANCFTVEGCDCHQKQVPREDSPHSFLAQLLTSHRRHCLAKQDSIERLDMAG